MNCTEMLEQQANRHALSKYEQNLVYKSFNKLIAMVQKQKQKKFVQRQYLVVLAVKSFQAIKRHMENKQNQRVYLNKALEHYVNKLKKKAIKAFQSFVQLQAKGGQWPLKTPAAGHHAAQASEETQPERKRPPMLQA